MNSDRVNATLELIEAWLPSTGSYDLAAIEVARNLQSLGIDDANSLVDWAMHRADLSRDIQRYNMRKRANA